MSAEITPNGFMVLIVIAGIAIIAITSMRVWILRDQTKTLFTYISDGSLLVFVGCYLAIGVIMFVNSVEEKRVLSKYSDPLEVITHLETTSYLKRFTACSIMYTGQLWLLKAAYISYFLRLRAHFSKRTALLIYIVAGYAVCSFVVMFTIQFAWCRPFNRNWVFGPQNCVVLQTLWGSTLQAWLNLTTDILILIISIIAISSLQLGRRERVALFSVASLGSVSIVMCLVRFIEVYNVAKHPETGTVSVIRSLYMWATFESTFAFVAFCLPSFRVLLRNKVFHKAGKPVLSSFHAKGSGASKASKKIKVKNTIDISFYENNSQTELREVKHPWENVEGTTVTKGTPASQSQASGNNRASTLASI